MNKDEMKTSTIENLRVSLKEAQKELMNLRVQNEQRKLKNGHSINVKKKEIARIMTFLTEKDIKNAG